MFVLLDKEIRMAVVNEQTHRILKGQVFFISSQQKLNYLVSNINFLGGRVEVFFSKEVTFLLVDDFYIEEFHKACKLPQLSAYHEGYMTMHPAVRDKTVLGWPDNMPLVPSSSQMCLAAPKAKRQRTIYDHPTFRLIQKAFHLGIAVIGICQFTTFIQNKLSIPNSRKRKPCVQKTKLNGCFIKVEDLAKKFKTFYRTFSENPAKHLVRKNLLHSANGFKSIIYEEFKTPNHNMVTMCQVDKLSYNQPPMAFSRLPQGNCYAPFISSLQIQSTKLLPNPYISTPSCSTYNSAFDHGVLLNGQSPRIYNQPKYLPESNIRQKNNLIAISNQPNPLQNVPKQNEPAPPNNKVTPKTKKKQNHFCECCNIYFYDLHHHILGERHRDFSNDSKNFECVTELLETLPTLEEFLYKHNSNGETVVQSSSQCIPLDFSISRINVDSTHLPLEMPKPLALTTSNLNHSLPKIKVEQTVESLDNQKVLPNIIDAIPTEIKVQNNPSSTSALVLDKISSTEKADCSMINFDFDADCWLSAIGSGDPLEDLVRYCDFYDKSPFPSTKSTVTINDEKSKDQFMHNSLTNSSNRPIASAVGTVSTVSLAAASDTAPPDIKVAVSDTVPTDIKTEVSDTMPVEIKLEKEMECEPKDDDLNSALKFGDICINTLDIVNNTGVDLGKNDMAYTNFFLSSEKMFSSEASELGKNEMISNVLTFINNSDPKTPEKTVSLPEAKVSVAEEKQKEGTTDESKLSSYKSPEKQTKAESCENINYTKRRKKVPALWSVSPVSSQNICLRFTCLRQEQVILVTSDDESASSISPKSVDNDSFS